MHRRRLLLVLASLAAGVMLVAGLFILLTPQRVAAAPEATFPVIADFEGGVPDGWFVYGDWGNISVEFATPVISDTDPLAIPGQVGDNGVLSGTVDVPTWAGFGAGLNPVQDWSDYDALSLWFYGENSGNVYTVEIQTVPGDDRRTTFTDSFTGWRQVVVPFSTFGAGGAYDVSQVDNWVMVLDGVTGSFLLDHIALVNLTQFASFDEGVPDGWFVYGDWGNISVEFATPVFSDTHPMAIPGQIGDNGVLSGTVDVPTWAGFGAAFSPVQDWSDMEGISFWFYGEDSGTVHEIEIQTVPGDDRRATFVDDVAGWKYVVLPFATFGAGGAYDVSQVDNWVFVLDGTVGSFKLDAMGVYGDAGSITHRVSFSSSDYVVDEGAVAEIVVSLNVTTTDMVTVTYATADGTAVAGVDYIPTSGTVTIPAGAISQTFTVETIDNDVETEDLTVLLALSNPQNAVLGARSEATLTIVDNDAPALSGKTVIIDDFEDGTLPSGTDPNGIGVGFVTWNHPSASAAITVTDAPPVPVPGGVVPNLVLQEDLTIGSGQWAGYTHAFTNETADQWLNQDWSTYVGISLWLYGNNTGGTLFLDILDNRNPGSTTDDAERWSVDIPDNFDGWQFFQFAWEDFHRKEIGNGAPNDGFTLTEVHGYGIGGYGSVDMGSNTYYVDDVGVIVRTTVIDDFEDGMLPSGTDPNGIGVGFVTWNHPSASAAITVTDAPPVPVPGGVVPNLVLQEDLTIGSGQWAGYTHAFTNETADQWLNQDWSTYEGICLWLYGNNTGGTLFLDILDNRNPGSTTDDAERWSVDIPDNFDGWQFFQFAWEDFHRKEIGNGAPNDGFTLTEVHGYGIGGYGSVDMGSNTYYVDDVTIFGNTGAGTQELQVAFGQLEFTVAEGDMAPLTVTLNMTSTEPVTVTYSTAESYAVPDRNFVPVSGTVVIPPGALEELVFVETLADGKHTGDLGLMVNLRTVENASFGFLRRAFLTIEDQDPADPMLLDDFQGYHPFATSGNAMLSITEIMSGTANALPGQGPYEQVLTVDYDTTAGEVAFSRVYPTAQDWSTYNGISLWYYGSNSGQPVTVQVHDNQATTTGAVNPADWVLVWSDEFDDPAGTPPNPNKWSHEIGDGTMNGIPGWGNGEFQFYTDDPANASTDGSGNLVLSLQELDETSGLLCWYGPCEYTSARLISWHKNEFEYGRMEARIKVPDGEAGLWPAWWMLGTDIDQVGWPQTGEIDIMEYVSRLPEEVFGTIHGPGYSGGNSFGNTYPFPGGVAQDYHTFSVEWAPDEIHWYVDGINYHNAIPSDVAPNQWVFNHPFFLLLNMAIGGNFGGDISPDLTFPQNMIVDYVRVYQAADTAERFEATFVDNFSGWQQVTLPFAGFARSAVQPVGAPDDGFGLNEVWGYGIRLPQPIGENISRFHMDQVQLSSEPTAVSLTDLSNVRSAGDSFPWLPAAALAAVLAAAVLLAGAGWRRRQS